MPVAIDISWHDLEAEAAHIPRHWALLGDAERVRAVSFHAPRDRRRFIARHGVLRARLAPYLGCAPEAIRFTASQFGKPAVEGDIGFSLSQSRGVALIAIAPGIEVGCDIERRDPAFACAETAARFFAPGERRRLAALPAVAYAEAFYDCWTRKEAFLKALGCGLQRPLDSFEVSLAPGEPAQLLAGCDGWSVASLRPLPLFHAAVVAPGEGWRLALPKGLAA